MDDLVTPRELGGDGELFRAVASVVFIDSSYSDGAAKFE